MSESRHNQMHSRFAGVKISLRILRMATSTSRRSAALGISAPLVIGFLYFAVEASFAAQLQAGLEAIGVATGGTPARSSFFHGQSVTTAILLLLAIGSVRALLAGAQHLSQGLFTERFRSLFRYRILDDVEGHGKIFGDRVVAHFTEDVNRTADSLWWIASAIAGAIQTILATFALIYLSPVVTGVLVLASLVGYLPLHLLSRSQLERFSRASEFWETASRSLLDALRNHTMLKIYRAEASQYAKVRGAVSRQTAFVLAGHVAAALRLVHPQFLGVAGIAGIIFASHRFGAFAEGTLFPYLYLMGRTAQNISSLSVQIGQIKAISGNAEAIRPYMTAQPSTDLPATRSHASAGGDAKVRLGWRLENVTFRYPGAPQPVIEDLDLSLAPGTFTLITGASGTGKSTLLQILIGELQPERGKVDVDFGTGLKGSTVTLQDQLFSQIGYVGAGGALLHASIRENLVLGLDRTPSAQELGATLKACKCDFVFALPQGLDTVISPADVEISTGQRQRIALARALIRKPRALLLDEATANLDGETARLIADEIIRMKGQVTIVAISHGSEFAEFADLHVDLNRRTSRRAS